MQPLVSIVIPVYNVQKYLSQCLDSVIKQTYKNIEVIIVDDGSTDASLSICMNYKEKNENIIVIHQNNMGLSVARNRGISEANGEYLIFIDSDDFVSEFFVETLVETILITGVDIASTKSYISFVDGKEDKVYFEKEIMIDNHVHLYNRDKFIELMMLEKICTGAQFKIYSRKIFEENLFPRGYFEDLAFMYKVCATQDIISVVDLNLYAYRKRNDGIIRSSNNANKKSIIIKITDEMVNFFMNYSPSVLEAVKARSFITIFSVFVQIPKNDEELMNEMWKRILKYRNIKKVKNNKYRIEVFISYFGMDISHYIGGLLKKFKRN